MTATDLMPTLTLAGAVLVVAILAGIRSWISTQLRTRRARRARAAPRHRRRRGEDPELRKAIREWVR